MKPQELPQFELLQSGAPYFEKIRFRYLHVYVREHFLPLTIQVVYVTLAGRPYLIFWFVGIGDGVTYRLEILEPGVYRDSLGVYTLFAYTLTFPRVYPLFAHLKNVSHELLARLLPFFTHHKYVLPDEKEVPLSRSPGVTVVRPELVLVVFTISVRKM